MDTRTARAKTLLSAVAVAALAVPTLVITSSPAQAVTNEEATQLITLPRPIMAVYAHSTAVVPGIRPQGASAGGPGNAEANAAVAAGCNDGSPLADPQWYALPDTTFGEAPIGNLQINQRGAWRGETEPLPAKFAIVNVDSYEIIACITPPMPDPEGSQLPEPAAPVVVPDDTSLLVVGYYETAVPQCDVEEEQSCAEPNLDWVIHQVSDGPPANDDWQDAVQVPNSGLPFVHNVNMQNATQDGPMRADWARCIPNAVNLIETADAWYRYTPAVSGPLEIGVESSYLGYQPFYGVARLTANGPVLVDPNAEFEECFDPPTLVAGVTYLIFVQSRYDSFYGEAYPIGGPTTIVIGTPGAARALPPRAVLVVLGPDPLSARVIWLPSRTAAESGVTSYQVTVEGRAPVVVDVASGEWSRVFEGLQPWRSYDITVRPRVGTTLGLPGHSFVFLAGDTPSAPRNVTTKAPGKSKNVKLTWDAPAHEGDSDITGYQIKRYVVNTDGTRTLVQTLTVDADRTRVMFHKLVRGTTYDFDVVALNDEGAGVSASSANVTLVKPGKGHGPKYPHGPH